MHRTNADEEDRMPWDSGQNGVVAVFPVLHTEAFRQDLNTKRPGQTDLHAAMSLGSNEAAREQMGEPWDFVPFV